MLQILRFLWAAVFRPPVWKVMGILTVWELDHKSGKRIATSREHLLRDKVSGRFKYRPLRGGKSKD